mmetsp:Transcript_2610/g.6681  ORF Transcript_2610/g.6681 Transcript_2610/m.6681 type:complete len:207 (-) Transcript_2610:618-1238(-)
MADHMFICGRLDCVFDGAIPLLSSIMLLTSAALCGGKPLIDDTPSGCEDGLGGKACVGWLGTSMANSFMHKDRHLSSTRASNTVVSLRIGLLGDGSVEGLEGARGCVEEAREPGVVGIRLRICCFNRLGNRGEGQRLLTSPQCIARTSIKVPVRTKMSSSTSVSCQQTTSLPNTFRSVTMLAITDKSVFVMRASSYASWIRGHCIR